MVEHNAKEEGKKSQNEPFKASAEIGNAQQVSLFICLFTYLLANCLDSGIKKKRRQ